MAKSYEILSISKEEVVLCADTLVDEDDKVRITAKDMAQIASVMRDKLHDALDDSFWEIFSECMEEAVQEVLF